MAAVNWVLLTKVVAREWPFQFTTSPETKSEPFTVSRKPAPPGAALAGTRGSAIWGTGLGVPVPVRLTNCGLPGALSVTVRSPFRVPSAVGVNVTLIVQLAPARTELPQLLFSAKSPLVAML